MATLKAFTTKVNQILAGPNAEAHTYAVATETVNKALEEFGPVLGRNGVQDIYPVPTKRTQILFDNPGVLHILDPESKVYRPSLFGSNNVGVGK